MMITVDQHKKSKKYRITKRNDNEEILEVINDLSESYLEGLYHSIETALPELCK